MPWICSTVLYQSRVFIANTQCRDICFKQLIPMSYVCLICMTYDVCLSQLLEESHNNFPQLDRFYKETKEPLKSNREKERETLRAVGSYQQLPLHHFLSFLFSHYPTSSHHQMTPSQLEMYVRICVERIFFLLLFAHLLLWFNSPFRARLRREERGPNLFLPAFLSLSHYLLSFCTEL